jgi:hypothetical protein
MVVTREARCLPWRITWFLSSESHQHMTGAQDLFVSFTVSNSSMYEELGRRTRHVV